MEKKNTVQVSTEALESTQGSLIAALALIYLQYELNKCPKCGRHPDQISIAGGEQRPEIHCDECGIVWYRVDDPGNLP